jgi:hypothetical protein
LNPYAGLQGQIAQRLGPYLNQQNLPYTGPRIAPFSANQLAGIMSTRNTAAAYNPASMQAGNLITSATGLDPQGARGIMSPYISGVVDEIARQGNQNLTQNVLPNIDDQFIKAGQFKSSRQGDITSDAIAKSQREISGLQSQAMQSGFTDVMNRALQGAQLGANLGTSSRQGLLNVGGMEQQQGQQNLDLAYSDFMRQYGQPLQNLSQINQFTGTGGNQYYTPQNGNPIAGGIGGALAGYQIGNALNPTLPSGQPTYVNANQYGPLQQGQSWSSWGWKHGGRVQRGIARRYY